jgi:hypothetical protein
LKKTVTAVFLIGILIGLGVGYLFFVKRPIDEGTLGSRELAYSYLVNSYNSTIGLCYVTPQDKNVYWLTNDNVLASYVLQQWNREIADNITETIQRIAKQYGLLASQTGIPLNCRAEILLGYNVDYFFNMTELITLDRKSVV